jgi:site-specific DNA-methyltransferase (adenine-specific)
MTTTKDFKDRVILGDCLDILPRLPEGSIDMVLCDLPYGCTACSWDTRLPLDRLFAEYRRIVKENGAIVLTATQPFTTALINAAPDLFRYDLVWDKVAPVGFLNAKRMPLRRHESVLVFYRRLPYYDPQFEKGLPYKSKGGDFHAGVYRELRKKASVNEGRRYPTSVLAFPREMGARCRHPTQKPVALFEFLVRSYTRPGETVLDNCSGSGTTALACLRASRHYVCIEREASYHAVSLERLAHEAAALQNCN